MTNERVKISSTRIIQKCFLALLLLLHLANDINAQCGIVGIPSQMLQNSSLPISNISASGAFVQVLNGNYPSTIGIEKNGDIGNSKFINFGENGSIVAAANTPLGVYEVKIQNFASGCTDTVEIAVVSTLPAAGSDCSSATTIDMDCFTADMNGATASNILPEPTCTIQYEDVWFKGTSTSNTVTITWDLNFQGQFPVIQALTGNCGNLTEIACQALNFPNPTMTISLSIGTTVFIRVMQDGGGANQMFNFCSTSLPLTLTDLKAQTSGKMNLVTGSYTQAIGVDYIELQSSADGLRFTSVDRQEIENGNPHEEISFEFTDKAKHSTTYYRLKVMDFDGQYEYSKIVSVHNADIVTSNLVYPNPAQDMIYIQSINDRETQVQILDAIGKIIMDIPLPEDGAINISKLKSGLYWIRVGEEITKIIKL